MFQRKTVKFGSTLGKTTGWIHRLGLKKRDVHMINGVTYDRIDDQGLHYTKDNKQHTLSVDHIILCTGQLPLKSLYDQRGESKSVFHLIGGSCKVEELDAKFAIDQGSRLASDL